MNKYGAKRTEVDGIKFASLREARRYQDLKTMERAGIITDLVCQPAFPFIIDERPVLIRSKGYPNGRKAKYIADFSYLENGCRVVEDSKGMDTPVSRLKRALVEAIYGVEVRLS